MQMCGQTGRQICRYVGRQADRYVDMWTDRQTDMQICGQTAMLIYICRQTQMQIFENNSKGKQTCNFVFLRYADIEAAMQEEYFSSEI